MYTPTTRRHVSAHPPLSVRSTLVEAKCVLFFRLSQPHTRTCKRGWGHLSITTTPQTDPQYQLTVFHPFNASPAARDAIPSPLFTCSFPCTVAAFPPPSSLPFPMVKPGVLNGTREVNGRRVLPAHARVWILTATAPD